MTNQTLYDIIITVRKRKKRGNYNEHNEEITVQQHRKKTEF